MRDRKKMETYITSYFELVSFPLIQNRVLAENLVLAEKEFSSSIKREICIVIGNILRVGYFVCDAHKKRELLKKLELLENEFCRKKGRHA